MPQATTRDLFRTRFFWIAFGCVGLMGAAVGIPALYDKTRPIRLDIDGQAAVDSASALAMRMGWGQGEVSPSIRLAVLDTAAAAYVERTLGDRDAYRRALSEGPYHPYVIRVSFRESGRWVRVDLTPDAVPYGFVLSRARDPTFAALPEDSARALALSAVSGLGHSSRALRPVPLQRESPAAEFRTHTFAFEDTTRVAGAARVGVRVKVVGAEVVEVVPTLERPTDWADESRLGLSRSWESGWPRTFVIILSVLLAIAAVTSLRRVDGPQWRPALAMTGVIGILAIPWLIRIGALDASGVVLLMLVGGPALIATWVVLTAGESLSRRVFPDHVYVWRLHSRRTAASDELLGLVLGGYLLAACILGLKSVYWYTTHELLGWWSPASVRSIPSTYPLILMLENVSYAVNPAIFEEILFRAIPLSFAVLLGARYGRPWAWVGGMLIVQAIVFGVGHAGGPYSDLSVGGATISGLIYGVIFLRFGLVPVVVAHFANNMTVGIMKSVNSGGMLDTALGVSVLFIPLAIVIGARIRHGGGRAPEEAYNRAWSPTSTSTEVADRNPGIARNAPTTAG